MKIDVFIDVSLTLQKICYICTNLTIGFDLNLTVRHNLTINRMFMIRKANIDLKYNNPWCVNSCTFPIAYGHRRCLVLYNNYIILCIKEFSSY